MVDGGGATGGCWWYWFSGGLFGGGGIWTQISLVTQTAGTWRRKVGLGLVVVVQKLRTGGNGGAGGSGFVLLDMKLDRIAKATGGQITFTANFTIHFTVHGTVQDISGVDAGLTATLKFLILLEVAVVVDNNNSNGRTWWLVAGGGCF